MEKIDNMESWSSRRFVAVAVEHSPDRSVNEIDNENILRICLLHTEYRVWAHHWSHINGS